MNITLLGPQRKVMAARAAVTELMPEGSIATINAGWQERESDTGELADVLGGRMINLELFRRWQHVQAVDPEYAAGERQLTQLLAEIQRLYAIRLHHAMSAVSAVSRRAEVPAVHEVVIEDAVRTLDDLDQWHLQLVAETRNEFYAAVRLGERESIVEQRRDLRTLVEACSGMVLAGGHVGIVLHLLHIFGVTQLIRPPLIAWSAGAMALSDRVVLFHDRTPQGYPHPQMYAEGLGAFRGVLPFPHARRRLRLEDPRHLALMVRRFGPRTCLLLADGVRVDLRDQQPLPAGARYLAATGEVVVAGDDHERA